jgi:hypothetical protein
VTAGTQEVREAASASTQVVREAASASTQVVREAALAEERVVESASDAAQSAVASEDASVERTAPRSDARSAEASSVRPPRDETTSGFPGAGAARPRPAADARPVRAGAPDSQRTAMTAESAARRVAGGWHVSAVRDASLRALGTAEPAQSPMEYLHARVAGETLPATQPADDPVATQATDAGAAVERGWSPGWLPFTGICLLVLLAMAAGFMAGGGALGWARRKVALG